MDEKIKILLFGILAEKIGKVELFFPLQRDSDTLLLKLKERHVELNELVFTMAINRFTITENTTINNNDEIALLPPFSGG